MNMKNAFGFVTLGLVMHAVPWYTDAYGDAALVGGELATRMVWLVFMGYVTGLIGLAYVAKESLLRLPVLWTAVKTDPWIRPLLARTAEARVPEGARAMVSN